MQIEPTPQDSAQDNRRTNTIVAGAVALILLLAGVGGWWVGTQRSNPVEVSTDSPTAPDTNDDKAEGEGEGEQASAAADEGSSPDEPAAQLPTATAAPGAPLVFTDIADDSAPGGYNVWQNGRSNGLYYVLSTAPGVTWESQQADCGGECYDPVRNDTLYTFDGASWNRTDLADRFVTNLSSTADGLLYTLSTGSPAGPALELGTSSDTGSSWTWTSLDLTNQPGADDGRARVLTAERGGEFLVIVHAPAEIDWEEAAALARSAGLDITSDQIWGVTEQGIEYGMPSPDLDESDIDCAAIDIAFHEDNNPSTEYPFEGVEELTEAQQAELDGWYLVEQAAWAALELASAEHMAGIEGCESYAACLSQSLSIRNDIDAGEAAMWDALGFGPDIDWDTITEDQSAALDQAYATAWAPFDEWYETSGCTDILGWDEGENVAWTTWDELGVTPPSSWNGSIHAHHIADGVASDLGSISDTPIGWLVSLDATATGWELWMDAGLHEENLRHLTSTDGADWTLESEYNDWDSVTWWTPATDANGNQWRIDWVDHEDGGNRLVRTDTSGASQSLSVDNLAGTVDLDLDGYNFDDVRTGTYGTIVWASRWDFEQDYAVDSVVFFSSDGIEWGATPIDGSYIVDAIVGDGEVLVFGERPDLVNSGTPQPVMIGTAG